MRSGDLHMVSSMKDMEERELPLSKVWRLIVPFFHASKNSKISRLPKEVFN
jgi:hypothetical protein